MNIPQNPYGQQPQQNPFQQGGGQGPLQALQAAIPPQVLQNWMQLMGQMPEQARARFLRQQLMAIPGLQERLQAFQSPQNTNVTSQGTLPPMGGPPGMNTGGTFETPMMDPYPPISSPQQTVPLSDYDDASAPYSPPAPTNPRADTPTKGEPGRNPNRFKGRLKHGKGLPPGQMKKQIPDQGMQTGGGSQGRKAAKAAWQQGMRGTKMNENIYGSGLEQGAKDKLAGMHGNEQAANELIWNSGLSQAEKMRLSAIFSPGWNPNIQAKTPDMPQPTPRANNYGVGGMTRQARGFRMGELMP